MSIIKKTNTKKIKLFQNFFFTSFFLLAFLLFTNKALAQVVINEFSSGTSSDWVEIYNLGEPLDISLLTLVDNDTNQKVFPSCILPNGGTYAVDWSNRLNNPGDRIGLIKDGQLIDCVSYGSGPACEGREIDLEVLSESEFAGRSPVGTGVWGKTTSATKSNNSSCLALTPTSSDTPVPSSTLTPTPLTKANYKINEVKDSEGTVISSVEIYVDGNYVHHFAPETLEFCDGCHCDDDKNVDCGLGEHTIKLEMENYADWSESKTFSVGNNFEVNPILSKNSPTATDIPATPVPTSTPRPTSTPKPTVTPKLSPTPTLSEYNLLASESAEEVLGIDISQAATESSVNQEKKKKFNFWPFVFIIPGLGMICFSVLLLRKQKI